jgi:hypothetical protein
VKGQFVLRIYLLSVGVILLAASVFSAVARVRVIRHQRRLAGHIVSWVEIDDCEVPPSTYYSMVISFTDDLGVQRQFASRVGYPRPMRPVGAACLVSYDSARPERTAEVSFAAQWGWTFALALLGLLSIASSLLIE